MKMHQRKTLKNPLCLIFLLTPKGISKEAKITVAKIYSAKTLTIMLTQDYITMTGWNKKNCNQLEYLIVIVV